MHAGQKRPQKMGFDTSDSSFSLGSSSFSWKNVLHPYHLYIFPGLFDIENGRKKLTKLCRIDFLIKIPIFAGKTYNSFVATLPEWIWRILDTLAEKLTHLLQFTSLAKPNPDGSLFNQSYPYSLPCPVPEPDKKYKKFKVY